jgi:two-component system, OmpR family, response regulator
MGRFSIYIVEDNNLYSYFLNESLKEYDNFNISIFDKPEKCLEYLDDKPDMIILDHCFSNGMNGWQAYQNIRMKHPEVPVVIISDQKDVQVAADFILEGVYEYIEKKDTDLLTKLKNLVLTLKK